MTDLHSLGSFGMTPTRGASGEQLSEAVSGDGRVCCCGQSTALAVVADSHGITAPFPSCMDCDSADKPVRFPFVLSPPPARDFPAAVEPQASAAGVFDFVVPRDRNRPLAKVSVTRPSNSKVSSISSSISSLLKVIGSAFRAHTEAQGAFNDPAEVFQKFARN